MLSRIRIIVLVHGLFTFRTKLHSWLLCKQVISTRRTTSQTTDHNELPYLEQLFLGILSYGFSGHNENGA